MKDDTKSWIAFAGDNLHSAMVLLESGLLNPRRDATHPRDRFHAAHGNQAVFHSGFLV